MVNFWDDNIDYGGRLISVIGFVVLLFLMVFLSVAVDSRLDAVEEKPDSVQQARP